MQIPALVSSCIIWTANRLSAIYLGDCLTNWLEKSLILYFLSIAGGGGGVLSFYIGWSYALGE